MELSKWERALILKLLARYVVSSKVANDSRIRRNINTLIKKFANEE